MNRDPASSAYKLMQLLIESSPLIEEYTRDICPGCKDVCCRQQHGLYRGGDLLFLNALEVAIPVRDSTMPGEGPCESMGPQGCLLPRWMRPLKCTLYFCEPLLAEFAKRPPRRSRQLSALLQEMVEIRREMDEEETRLPKQSN